MASLSATSPSWSVGSNGDSPFDQLTQLFNFRESALPRIGTGVLLTTIGGYYAGTVILERALMDPYLASENVHRLKRVRHLYTVKAFQGSLLFFSGLELVHRYCKETNTYRNFFTDGLIASLCVYPAIRHSLKQSWGQFRPAYL